MCILIILFTPWTSSIHISNIQKDMYSYVKKCYSFSASRGENGSHPPHARISKSHPKDVSTPSIATPKGDEVI